MTEDSERYARSFEVLSGAHGLLGEDLDQYLDSACGDDQDLRTRVLELLAACADDSDGTDDAFADASLKAARQGLDEVVSMASTPWLPETIGDYQILRQIGSGGMGVVYEAQQSAPRRRVALKLLNPMQSTGDALRRFKREAELLGRLQHPGIAQIFEASTFDAGHGRQPYFAMELVDGLPITDYANAEDLDNVERLALLAELCDVIQYAHERGVIHRDLKPANILAASITATIGTNQDRTEDLAKRTTTQLKVLDFGIARVADPDLTTNTLQTSTGQIIGTVSYMSPEQASGDPSAIDPRSDVYTLGVLAYELLTHSLPHHSKGLMLHDAVRAIREDEPTSLGTIDRGLRGDVDTIVAKALEKDRERRYGSAAEMAADIRRHLADEPIRARPASTIYQLRKFARRNKALVGGVMTTLVAAIIGTTVAVSYAFDSHQRADELERVAVFYTDQWDLVDLGAMAGRLEQTTVEGVQRVRAIAGSNAELDARTEELQQLLGEADFAAIAMQFLDETLFSTAQVALEEQFEDLPLVQARLFETLSITMHRLGLVSQAAPLQERALEIHQREQGDDHPATLRSLSLLGHIRHGQNEYEQATELIQSALERQRLVLPADSPEIRDSLRWLIMALPHTGTDEDYLVVQRERVALSIERNGPDSPVALMDQASLLHIEGHLEEAAEMMRKSLEGYHLEFGEHGLGTLIGQGNLASLLLEMGRLKEAEELARRMLTGSREQLGEQHPQSTNALFILGRVLHDAGKLKEAESQLRTCFELRNKHYGADNETTLLARHHLDLVLEARAR
ncbi:MAG: serine/threonine protein kinase/tetratricopeptide (TPR) repeat protein [Planctomycetota bacterium]|jgi:serine/threonine protein kinase/tetratricopeptide (TPR) repeat protein